MAELIVISGPIGAGKSTVANGLGRRFVDSGLSAAVVDLDDVVAMIRAPLELFDWSWERARRIHGQVIAAWLHSGVHAVIAHGPIHTAAEDAALVADIPGLVPRRVRVRAPYDVALERIKDDLTRGVSKDPTFLRSAHERFCELLPSIPACEWDFDTTRISATEITDTLRTALIPRSGTETDRGS
ncbi:MAG: hypothetical protein H0X05_04555 [Actinobacteria bacterium]|nr:hypothetical protein [Actinomycetota bacterium]